VVSTLASDGNVDGVLVCPQGFTADHLEVLYDLDVVARERTEAVGLTFGRTAMVNDDATVLTALAAEVRALAA
jgi:ferrochelatase